MLYFISCWVVLLKNEMMKLPWMSLISFGMNTQHDLFTFVFFFLCTLWTCTKLKALRARVYLTGLGKEVFLSPFYPRYSLSCFHIPYKATLGKAGLVSCSFRGQKTILVSGQGKWVFPHLGSPCWLFGFNCSRPLIPKRAASVGAYHSKLPGMTLLILL